MSISDNKSRESIISGHEQNSSSVRTEKFEVHPAYWINSFIHVQQERKHQIGMSCQQRW